MHRVAPGQPFSQPTAVCSVHFAGAARALPRCPDNQQAARSSRVAGCTPDIVPEMSFAELLLLLTLLPLPIVLGMFAAYFQKPWWWAALVAVVLAMLATIAPTPEAGQPRVAAGDLLFLLVVALWAAAVAWAGWFLARRLLAGRQRRTGAGAETGD